MLMLESTARGHILIVDDDAGVRTLFAEVLRLAGYATVEAHSVRHAADILLGGDPEVICILLDSRLPDGRGVDLLRRVRDDAGGETLPVIVVTGDDSVAAEIEGLEAGATDYLYKPVTPEALVARVATHLRDRAAWLARLDAVAAGRGGAPDSGVIAGVIAQGSFRPVFQPIVDLVDGGLRGYEALTRFDDAAPPDVRFREALAVGLGPDLELATLARALESATDLPDGAFVSLNVTPGLLHPGGERLQEVLRSATCPVVLEITEREVIDDYGAIRSVVSALEPTVRLSIDDAGAGFASMRHVVMLEPNFVKLDRTWVTGIEGEPTKQAMVAGLVHFASSTGCHLIAEGIETESERSTLIDLGVGLGQGYLLGRPEAVR
jgi:EAL domain-containing protein (putative c-di-GMP-specific phosphodiesterase class I)/CheY-like chemotaxis protein